VALDRLTNDPATEQLTYRSDTADGPTTGAETVDPLESLARLLTHIPDPGQVMTRYYGWYASRTRGMHRRPAAGGAAVEEPVAITDPVNGSLRAARYRWAETLRGIFEVDRPTCPRCSSRMRVVAVITEPPVVTRILAHGARVLERARQSRGPPPGARRPLQHSAATHAGPAHP
jgi:hypothetical protein